MINIVIVIVLLGLVGWVCQLIAKIARPLGKVILVLLKFALIAGVIALVAFLVWKFGLLLWNRRATMLKVLVVIGIILAALVVICILYACVMRVRAHKFIKWLARNGIGESIEAPGDKAVWNWVNNGEKMIWYTEGQSNYFVYVPFYQNVLTHLNQEKVCAKDDFPKICRKERMMQSDMLPLDETVKKTNSLKIKGEHYYAAKAKTGNRKEGKDRQEISGRRGKHKHSGSRGRRGSGNASRLGHAV